LLPALGFLGLGAFFANAITSLLACQLDDTIVRPECADV
jgi:hypothetical protein